MTAALASPGVPAAARAFVATTMTLTERPAHEVAAAFLHSREDLVPEMFRRRLATLDADRGDPARYRSFRRYLERHIDLDENDLDENDLDENDHSPLAHDLLRRSAARMRSRGRLRAWRSAPASTCGTRPSRRCTACATPARRDET